MAGESARELLGELLAGGLRKADVARLIGRNSSLLTPIERGAKTGGNVRGALEELRDRVREGRPVERVEAPRRQRAAGGEARVRQSRTRETGAGSTSTKLGQQASRPASRTSSTLLRTLERQAVAGATRVAADVRFTRRGVSVAGNRQGASSGRKGHELRMSADIDTVIAEARANGGDVLAALLDVADVQSGAVTPGRDHIAGVELRTWGG